MSVPRYRSDINRDDASAYILTAKKRIWVKSFDSRPVCQHSALKADLPFNRCDAFRRKPLHILVAVGNGAEARGVIEISESVLEGKKLADYHKNPIRVQYVTVPGSGGNCPVSTGLVFAVTVALDLKRHCPILERIQRSGP